jgi:hypothetical protein
VPLRDELGCIVKWYGSGVEIEDRKRAEHAFRSSEAYLADAQKLTEQMASEMRARRSTP